MTLQEQLCEKMRVEQSAYCLWLTAQPPEEILNHAYEYSVREDIILATEEMNLTPARVRALLKSPAPLADVYKDFSKLETDYMSIVAQCVEDRAAVSYTHLPKRSTASGSIGWQVEVGPYGPATISILPQIISGCSTK